MENIYLLSEGKGCKFLTATEEELTKDRFIIKVIDAQNEGEIKTLTTNSLEINMIPSFNVRPDEFDKRLIEEEMNDLLELSLR